MSKIKLKSINDYRNNEEYFINMFTESITEKFAYTQSESYSYDGMEVENIAYYGRYIDDFSNSNNSRFQEINFKKFNPELKYIISCVNNLYINIIEVFISSYRIDHENLMASLSNYFNNLDIIKHYNLSLSLTKNSSHKIELNEAYKFVYDSLTYLQIQMNMRIFIDIENTPLFYSFNKMFRSFEKKIKKDSHNKIKDTHHFKLADFIRKIPASQIKSFGHDLVTQFNKEKGKEIANLCNILYTEAIIAVDDKQGKAFFDSLKETFEQDIGSYQNFMKYFPKNINHEIANFNNEEANPLIREVKIIKTKLVPLIEKYTPSN